MKYTLTAQIMAIGPWGQMAWINLWLGLFGLAVQIAGLIWMVCIGRSQRMVRRQRL